MASNRGSSKGKARSSFRWTSLGAGLAVAAIVLSTATMNIAGWYSIAESPLQQVTNTGMAVGFELMAITMLPRAGMLVGRGTYGKAVMALTLGVMAASINNYATQNFLLDQLDVATNQIETANIDVGNIDARISDLELEKQSIIERNGGVPRSVDTLEEAGRHFDDESNPINARERDREIGDRREYDRIQAQIDNLRDQRTGSAVTSNDIVRTVIPAQLTKPFVAAIEIAKAVSLFVIGNDRIFWGPSNKRGRRKGEKFFTPEMHRGIR